MNLSRTIVAVAIVLGESLACASVAQAWSNHGMVAFQAFRDMPEVANAPAVKAEPIEAFLKDQEPAIAELLDAQEAWKPDPSREDPARRRAFLEALRVAPNIRLSLYVQPDAVTPYDPARALPWSAVSTLREPVFNFHRFNRLETGDSVAAITVLSSARRGSAWRATVPSASVARRMRPKAVRWAPVAPAHHATTRC